MTNPRDRENTAVRKILRLNDDGSTPSDNPFAGFNRPSAEVTANVRQIFSYGLRNSFGMAFDPISGHLWEAQNGDDSFTVSGGVLTVTSTGQKFHVGPGSVISSPKNLEVTWDIDGPYFKKYWCIFNGTQSTPAPPRDLLVTNLNDNPPDWQAYHFVEPKEVVDRTDSPARFL